jgi:anti-anti-sigma factor
MSGVDPSRGFAVEHFDAVTVIRFTDAELTDLEMVQAIGQRMVRLVDHLSHHRFVVHLGSVHRMSSAMLGKLIAFHKKIKQAGGNLTLCSLPPDLYLKFQNTRLHTFFRICPSEEAALEGLGNQRPKAAEISPT